MTDPLPVGPDVKAVVDYIQKTYPETDTVQAMNAYFFSLDPEKHWPNYATLVTTDEHDDASDLDRPGVFRLNLGVDRETFEQIASSDLEPDFTAFDRLLPHPVYGQQRWISILNPTDETFHRRAVAGTRPRSARDGPRASRTRRGLNRGRAAPNGRVDRRPTSPLFLWGLIRTWSGDRSAGPERHAAARRIAGA